MRFLENRDNYATGLHEEQNPLTLMVPAEGVEPTHPHGYQILSLARLPIPPHRHIELQSLANYLLWELGICYRFYDSVAV